MIANEYVRYCGRNFTPHDIETIRRIIAKDPQQTRAHISRLVCEVFGWYKPSGGLKDMSCRVALLRMQEDGLFTLPPPRGNQQKSRHQVLVTSATDPQPLNISSVETLSDLCLVSVTEKQDSNLWREYIHRYHYLDYSPIPGDQLRYMVKSENNLLALLSFGAAAWQIAPRDRFIGWTHDQRQTGLYLITNNARFLILPWIRVKNLASKLLAMVVKRLPDDWERNYGYRPVLLESFVERDKFQGTCYKAANWIFVGTTKGRGKLGNKAVLPKKNIWLYPLVKKFREHLIHPG